MELKPVGTDRPAYPIHPGPRRRLAPWLRRLVVAAGASAAMWMGTGCDGGPWAIGGAVMEPEPPRACSDQAPEDAALVSVPGRFTSSLCGTDQASWGTFELQLNTPLVFFFSEGAGLTVAEILDEEGQVVDELTPDDESIELTLPPGKYFLAVSPSEEGMGYDWFTLDIEFAEAHPG